MSYEPTSQLAINLLQSPRFTPFSGGFLSAQWIADQTGATLGDVNGCLTEFAEAGLLEAQHKDPQLGQTFSATSKAWRLREHLLRKQGLRHVALTKQKDFDLKDLIIAVLKAGHVFNDRLSGSFIGGSTEKTVEHLAIYLGDYSEEQIANACAELVAQRLLRRRTASSASAFDLNILGEKAYDEHVAATLCIAKGETILDEILQETITVFYAWQSECKPARNRLGEAIDAVFGDLNKLEGLVRPLKLVQAAEEGDGAVRIDQQLLDRVKKADFFLGDVTPVFAYERRLRANDNVLVEVGYALASKPPEQIILVAMERNDLAQGNPQFAFDIKTVRRHDWPSKEKLKDILRAELEAGLRRRGWLH